MEKKDGGPAFPQTEQSGAGNLRTELHGGMTLRDYFAGQALAGILSDAGSDVDDFTVARRAYEIATQMLVERDK